jgi:hypothetical protein
VTDKEIFIVLDADNVLHTFIVYPDDVEEGGLSCVNLGTTKVTNSKLFWLEKTYKKNYFVNSTYIIQFPFHAEINDHCRVFAYPFLKLNFFQLSFQK